MIATYRYMFMGKCLVVVWLILIFSSVDNAEYITVTRGLTYRGSNKVEDIFSLPSSLCNANPKCSQFDGNLRSAQKCTCECPRSKSTFYGNSGQLKCTDNVLVRNSAGCNFKFYRASEVTDPNAPLEVVSGHYFRYLYPLRENTKWSCQIVPSTSTYQDCAGNWLPSPNGWARFKISVEIATVYFSFKLKPDPQNNYSHLNGKVVKLSVRCMGNIVEDSCLLFKVKGPVNCTADLPTSSVVSSSTTTSSTTIATVKISTVSHTTTRPVDVITTSSPVRPIDEKTTSSPLTTEKEVIPHSSTTLAPMDNSSAVIENSMSTASTPTTIGNKDQGGGIVTIEPAVTVEGEQISETGNNSSSMYIAVGAVLAAAVIVLSVLLAIMCRRNSNRPLGVCWKKSTTNRDKDNRAQTSLQMAPVYDAGNYMMPVETSTVNSHPGRRKGFANPTYERGRDNTVKFRNFPNGTAEPHDERRDSSNVYTDTDFLSSPLPPIPGPSGNQQPVGVDVYDTVANQSDDDQMYQSVDKFSPRQNGAANVNFSAPMYCAPYHSSDICHGTSSDNNNMRERTAAHDPSRNPQRKPGQQEAVYQALNSPPSSPTSPNGPGISEYQPLVKVRPQEEQDAFA